ncbi:porin [Sporomusa termitida]|uniref:S-layer homology domain protein n=1 Tax=Sporomusa termitida TaxID=2377 RepID=A0A517DXI0_9FIRM|nr:porin [Sporomusa termitida]QDR82052.1 S-layer homology domain protein [Sporomusa termitida]
MKRQTALALAAVFSLSVAGTALAAPANPFVDVPAKHWAYDSVSKLAKAGVISGYGDGTYRGDRTLTRYEMAAIVGKALANSEKADAETQKELDALKTEFAAELNNLGVRVDSLEKKIDNVKITGEARIRYEDKEQKNIATFDDDGEITGWTNPKSKPLQLRTRLKVQGAINDDWTYVGRLQNTQDLKTGGIDANNEGKTELNWAYVNGPIGALDVTLGRFDATPAYGIALDDTIDGVQASFGNKLKVDIFAGRQDYVGDTKDDLYIANLGYAFSDKLNFKGAYFHLDPQDSDIDTGNLYEVGLDYQLTPNVNLAGAYLKSDADDENKGYFGQITYKGADRTAPKSFGAWVNYRDLEAGTLISTTLDYGAVQWDGKGYEVGFSYVPVKNARWTTSYTDLEGSYDSSQKAEYFLTKVDFYF